MKSQKTPESVGAARPIRDAREKVSGQKLYVADMELPGMLYGKMLLSPIAHGKIRSMDTREAEHISNASKSKAIIS